MLTIHPYRSIAALNPKNKNADVKVTTEHYAVIRCISEERRQITKRFIVYPVMLNEFYALIPR